jgi:serine/threonine-protein kinase
VLRPGLPTALANLLERMLSKSPEARPDARALVGALHALQAPAAPQAPAPLPSNRVSRLLKVLAFATPVGVLLLIGVGIIVIEHFLDVPQEAVTASTPASASAEQPITPPSAEEGLRHPPVDATPSASVRPVRKPRPESDAYLAGLDKKQVELRIKRTELLLEYTAQHPDVVQVDRQLEQLQIERRLYLQQRQRSQEN